MSVETFINPQGIEEQVDERGERYLQELRERLLALAEASDEIDTKRPRGGVSRCPTGPFLGYTFCLHTIVKLKVLVAAIGARAVVRMIQGSYSTSTSASAGTHAGGGAGDQALSSLAASADTLCMTIARDVAFLIYWVRPYISGLWSNHGHFIDPSCPNLSPEAAAQCLDFKRGYNGLANNGPDFGSRASVTRLWDMYLNRSQTTVASIEALFATADPKEWWEMAIPDSDLQRIANAVWDRDVDNPVTGTWDADTGLWSTNKYALDAMKAASEARAAVAALRAEHAQDMQAILAALKELGANPEPGPVNPWPKIAGPAYGADVSGHQTLDVCTGIAADKSKAFVIVKATEGRTFVNDLYDEQMDLFRTAEKMTGAYHFWWPTNSPQEDLDNYLRTAKLRIGEVPVLDAENWDQVHNYADMANLPGWLDRLLWAVQWCDLAEDALGARPWIYLNWNWIKQFRQAAGMVNPDGSIKTTQTELWQRLTASPLWGANPFKPAGQFEAVSGGWNAGIICHQYGESPYDLDYLYGDPSEAWWSHGAKKVAA